MYYATTYLHVLQCLLTFPLIEYDGVPIVVVGNLNGSKAEKLTYQQIPCSIMDDSTCCHLHKELSDYMQCKEILDEVIKNCYDISTGFIQILNQSTKRDGEDTFPKKRGILSYLSFRRKKSRRFTNRARSAKSMT